MLLAKAVSESEGLPLYGETLEQLLSYGHVVIDLSSSNAVLRYYENGRACELKLSFVSGAKQHRRKYGGGKGQAIAKAVGLHHSKRGLTVLDATAGQGSDAFVLACLGCKITMVERSSTARILLYSALAAGQQVALEQGDEALQTVFSNMDLVKGNFIELAKDGNFEAFDVVYLDPMFPARKKSALVKKEMQIFHKVIGADTDADSLLAPALAVATFRVVVKRPISAPFLAGEAPSMQLKGKSSRFDVYINRSFRKPDIQ